MGPKKRVNIGIELMALPSIREFSISVTSSKFLVYASFWLQIALEFKLVLTSSLV